MNYSIIVAMDENRVIGKDNQLPWYLPNDLKYVKKITEGKTIVLGRKNYESIGFALPNRRNIVLTRQDISYENCEMAKSVEDVFAKCQKDKEIFIFGGEKIYHQFLPYVDKIYMTRIHHAFEGDTYFPKLNEEEWVKVSSIDGEVNNKNKFPHTFEIYERRK